MPDAPGMIPDPVPQPRSLALIRHPVAQRPGLDPAASCARATSEQTSIDFPAPDPASRRLRIGPASISGPVSDPPNRAPVLFGTAPICRSVPLP